jgi:TM2 domain-containing membrane protein YozV
VAGLLQIFVGVFGVGRFYLGYNGVAVAQLLTCGGLGVWALIDGILILTGKVRDPQGRPLRD